MKKSRNFSTFLPGEMKFINKKGGHREIGDPYPYYKYFLFDFQYLTNVDLIIIFDMVDIP